MVSDPYGNSLHYWSQCLILGLVFCEENLGFYNSESSSKSRSSDAVILSPLKDELQLQFKPGSLQFFGKWRWSYNVNFPEWNVNIFIQLPYSRVCAELSCRWGSAPTIGEYFLFFGRQASFKKGEYEVVWDESCQWVSCNLVII